mgnify:CR=1 FL=1
MSRAQTSSFPPPGYVLKWSADLNGDRLDEKKWMYRTGVRLESFQQPENVSVAAGNAIITIRKERVEGSEYTSGGLISRRKFRYGHYETTKAARR